MKNRARLILLSIIVVLVTLGVDVANATLTARVTITNESGASLTDVIGAIPLSTESLINGSLIQSNTLDTEMLFSVEANAGGEVPFMPSSMQTRIEYLRQFNTTGSAFTNEDTDANDDDINDVSWFDANPEIGDIIYFGMDNPGRIIPVNNGTAGAGSWTLTWEYWNGSAWAAHTGVDDTTDNLQNAGLLTVSYVMPMDWATTTINSVSAYWTRARTSAFSSSDTDPLGTQIWYETGVFYTFACDPCDYTSASFASATIPNQSSISYDLFLGQDPGRQDYGVFDGADSLVTVTDAAPIQDVWDSGGTFEAWVFVISDGEGGLGFVFDKAEDLLFVTDESGNAVKIEFRMDFSTTAGHWKSTDTVITLNQWTHIAVVYDADAVGNNPIIYINGGNGGTLTVGNGLTEDSTPVGTRVTNVGTDFTIGNRAAVTRTFDGNIDDVRIWDDERTAAEILANYLIELEGALLGANLQGNWGFNWGSGSVTYDRSINDNNGALTTTTWGSDFSRFIFPDTGGIVTPGHVTLDVTVADVFIEIEGYFDTTAQNTGSAREVLSHVTGGLPTVIELHDTIDGRIDAFGEAGSSQCVLTATGIATGFHTILFDLEEAVRCRLIIDGVVEDTDGSYLNGNGGTGDWVWAADDSMIVVESIKIVIDDVWELHYELNNQFTAIEIEDRGNNTDRDGVPTFPVPSNVVSTIQAFHAATTTPPVIEGTIGDADFLGEVDPLEGFAQDIGTGSSLPGFGAWSELTSVAGMPVQFVWLLFGLALTIAVLIVSFKTTQNAWMSGGATVLVMVVIFSIGIFPLWVPFVFGIVGAFIIIAGKGIVVSA